jgi:hypothetical protein
MPTISSHKSMRNEGWTEKDKTVYRDAKKTIWYYKCLVCDTPLLTNHSKCKCEYGDRAVTSIA